MAALVLVLEQVALVQLGPTEHLWHLRRQRRMRAYTAWVVGQTTVYRGTGLPLSRRRRHWEWPDWEMQALDSL